MKIRPKIVDFRAFCVELRPKQALRRIVASMSYILVVVNVNVNVNENVNVNGNATYRCVPIMGFGSKIS